MSTVNVEKADITNVLNAASSAISLAWDNVPDADEDLLAEAEEILNSAQNTLDNFEKKYMK